jgi:hypothetical protein
MRLAEAAASSLELNEPTAIFLQFCNQSLYIQCAEGDGCRTFYGMD